VQLYNSGSDCKSIGNIPGRHIVKAVVALSLQQQQQHQTSAIPPMLTSVQKQKEIRSQRGFFGFVSLFFIKKFLTKINWFALEFS
jgi:hypothetical protein